MALSCEPADVSESTRHVQASSSLSFGKNGVPEVQAPGVPAVSSSRDTTISRVVLMSFYT